MKLKISRWTPTNSWYPRKSTRVGINCLLVFQNSFSFFYSFFKPLKISLKFRLSPALSSCIQFVTNMGQRNFFQVPCSCQTEYSMYMYILYWLRSYVTVGASWKNWPNFSSSAFAIRLNLFHPQPSLFLFGLTLWVSGLT